MLLDYAETISDLTDAMTSGRILSKDAFESYRQQTGSCLKATFHLTISKRGQRGQRATGKIQRNDHHHASCGPFLTGKTSSVSLIFTYGTHWNVKNR